MRDKPKAPIGLFLSLGVFAVAWSVAGLTNAAIIAFVTLIAAEIYVNSRSR